MLKLLIRNKDKFKFYGEKALDIKNFINHPRFYECNIDDLRETFRSLKINCDVQPFIDGIVVIDYDTKNVYSYTDKVIPGAYSKADSETNTMAAHNIQMFYREDRVLLDKVDYLLNIAPWRVHTYMWDDLEVFVKDTKIDQHATYDKCVWTEFIEDKMKEHYG